VKKLIFTVTNDLSYDQRMHKICTSLSNAGYKIILVGRIRKNSIDFIPSQFSSHRIKCRFNKGKLFYFEYNIRLFFYLLFSSFDVISAVDLDTVMPCYLAAKLKSKPLAYDAHEYFTEVPEVLHRPMVQQVWIYIEKMFIPRIKYLYTVSDGLAEMYKHKYNVDFTVIRNTALFQEIKTNHSNEQYILYQGMLNKGRGLEAMIEAMKSIDSLLYLAGDGDIAFDLKEKAKKLNLEKKVKFTGLLTPEELRKFSINAFIGINLLQNEGRSYHFSLSNKFFDYMHAGIPQIAMNLPEYKKLNDQYQIAVLLDDPEPIKIARAIHQLQSDKELYQRLKENSLKARKELCWQNEEKKLIEMYDKI
jgi:glycosyltransferase involved in cell wall biosynthesis